jgi:hypothetical protein
MSKPIRTTPIDALDLEPHRHRAGPSKTFARRSTCRHQLVPMAASIR